MLKSEMCVYFFMCIAVNLARFWTGSVVGLCLASSHCGRFGPAHVGGLVKLEFTHFHMERSVAVRFVGSCFDWILVWCLADAHLGDSQPPASLSACSSSFPSLLGFTRVVLFILNSPFGSEPTRTVGASVSESHI